jgi:zinc and cadmium transporter
MSILLASLFVASLSTLGVFLFGTSKRATVLERFVVPFAIGTFLGVTFFELIPETFEGSESFGAVAIVGGFLLFYLLAHILRTYHHHHHEYDTHDTCETTKTTATLLLVGDAVHNFVDGVVLATAFMVNPVVGIVTTVGIAMHEIPQEIAEFGVLKRAGYTTKQAVAYNFLSASTVILGAGFALFLTTVVGEYVWILLGIAAGNLLYVALSDLIPGVQAVSITEGTFYRSFAITVLGIVTIVLLITWSHKTFGHGHTDHEHEEHSEDVPQVVLPETAFVR